MPDLHELCRDRDLVTPELHESNDFYGHAALLKRYASRSPLRSLKAAIEHGVILNDYVWDNDARCGMPLFLCASPRRAELFAARAAGTRAVPIGPMPHYAAAGMPPATTPAKKILLAFPSHSSHRVRSVFDANAFADRLEQVGKEFDAVHVCIYWRDVEIGLDREFAARGFHCVSAGHMFDPAFLPRLLTLLREATLVMTNEVGSSVLYAAYAGKPVWIEPQKVEYVAPEEILAVDVPAHLDHPNVKRLQALFAEPRGDLSAEQRDFTTELMGTRYVKTPGEISTLLDEAAQQYRANLTLARRVRDGARRLHYVRGRVKQELKNRWR